MIVACATHCCGCKITCCFARLFTLAHFRSYFGIHVVRANSPVPPLYSHRPRFPPIVCANEVEELLSQLSSSFPPHFGRDVENRLVGLPFIFELLRSSRHRMPSCHCRSVEYGDKLSHFTSCLRRFKMQTPRKRPKE